MWLATKYAAGKPLPDLGLVKNELGGSISDAILYRQLIGKHPEVELGPDQEISNHFSRLKAAERNFQARRNPDLERREKAREQGKLRPLAPVEPDTNASSWVTGPSTDSPTTPAGLPQRIPGWFTGGAMDTPPPGYGVPPMPKRTPGDSMRSPNSPSYAPKQQSLQDWVSWLGDQGITLNQALQRPDAANNQVPPPPRPRGQDIWAPFVPRGLRPATPPPQNPSGVGALVDKVKGLFGPRKRTASTVVAEYIEGVLIELGEMPRKTASRVHDVMTGDGWSHHESGSGDWYQKQIGDKVHRIIRQEDGWIHNSGPTADDMTGIPFMTDDIHNAIMRANRGKVQVGFKPPPISQQNFSSNSWSDER